MNGQLFSGSVSDGATEATEATERDEDLLWNDIPSRPSDASSCLEMKEFENHGREYVVFTIDLMVCKVLYHILQETS